MDILNIIMGVLGNILKPEMINSLKELGFDATLINRLVAVLEKLVDGIDKESVNEVLIAILAMMSKDREIIMKAIDAIKDKEIRQAINSLPDNPIVVDNDQ